MIDVWNKIKEILDILEPILLVVMPTCFGIYLKIKNKVRDKKEKIEKQDKEKNKEKFSAWEHAESVKIIDRIKTLCDYYKDTGHMDLVTYVQFENGTTATSKLCNMFLSCLAEDSRFGKISVIKNFQRIPYSRLSSWIDNLNSSKNNIFFVSDMSVYNKTMYSDFIKDSESINSFISGVIRDPEGMIIGICSFLYTEKDFSGRGEKQCITLMKKAIASTEAIFIEYHANRDKMKKELNL